jgi:ribokinase
MAKIVSVGAAVQDVFLSGKVFRAHREEGGDLVEEFPLGAKLEVEDIVITTGGGATNAAVTFARQGHESKFVGVVGKDPAGRLIRDALKAEGVSVRDTILTDKFHTGYSTLLLSPNGERTILVYRGASEHFERKDFDLEHVEADWLYITSLAGNLELLQYLLVLAEHKGMKAALDPGRLELEQAPKLKKLLPRLTVLKANRDELGRLSRADNAADIAADLARTVPIVVVTDGGAGSVACDGERVIRAGMYKDVKVVDRTGAGDAFGSGFVAALARDEPLEKALTLASANSTAVVQQIGAKAGILREGARLHPMPLKIKSL